MVLKRVNQFRQNTVEGHFNTGHEPDLSTAREHAEAIDKAMNEVRKLLPNAGSYVAESDFFDEAWRQSFWGRTTQSCSP
jgi:putative heme iron utilization protein